MDGAFWLYKCLVRTAFSVNIAAAHVADLSYTKPLRLSDLAHIHQASVLDLGRIAYASSALR
jgi:hypothetical protein